MALRPADSFRRMATANQKQEEMRDSRSQLHDAMTRMTKKPLSAALCLLIAAGAWLQVCQLEYLGRQEAKRNVEEQMFRQVGTGTSRYRPRGFALRAKTSTNRIFNLVKAGDFVYSEGWDSSPIVVESHKLVFFTVPKAGWVLVHCCGRSL